MCFCSLFVLYFFVFLWQIEVMLISSPYAQQRGFVPEQSLRWLFLDLNSYFASVEQNENPELRGRPVIVLPSDTDATCAIAASYEAKAYGIKTGTKVYEAKQKCPSLRTVLARHDVYVDYHERIFECIGRYIPVTKICSIDEGAFLLRGRDGEVERAHALSYEIKEALKREIGSSIRCSIGLAPSRLLAKIASDMQKTDGLTTFMPNAYFEQLFTLRLTDLPGINTRMEIRLNKAGVYTVQQFCALAPKQARQIWGGVDGERFWYSLHGYNIPDRATEKRVVGHSRMLDPEHRLPERARAMAQQLTLKAAARLRRYNLFAGRFSLQIRTTQSVRWGAEKQLKPATDHNRDFLNALNMLWGQMMCETKAVRLLKVSITMHGLQKPEHITLDLFSPQSHEDEKAQEKPLADQKVGQEVGQKAEEEIGLGHSRHIGTSSPAVKDTPSHILSADKNQNQRKASATPYMIPCHYLKAEPQVDRMMDRLNRRFGAGTVTLGFPLKTKSGHVGTKIAFSRVPEREEFSE
jgi:DNA polymerase-4